MQIFVRDGQAYGPAEPSPGYMSAMHVGRGLWKMDIDQDHRVDLVVTHQTEPVALLMNRTESSNHWIAIKLVGTTCERNAVGATVEVKSGETIMTQWCSSGEGYFGANEELMRFGLGDATTPVTIHIRWPDGTQDIWTDIEVDQTLTLVQRITSD